MNSWRGLWWFADAAMWYVGFAVVVRRCLVPWSVWLGRRVACWCRYALPYSRRGAAAPPPWTSTCPCCDGVDFDGMAGRWAVVTGCTDGIGKEYALQLADQRINVALVSRNADKLRAMAHEIHKRHAGAVQTRVVVADFTSSGGTVPLGRTYDAVRRGLAGLDVALLVNNAGLSYPRPDRLLDLPPCCSGATAADGDPCRDVIECNSLATVAMCRIVMPLMGAVGRDAPAADGPWDHREYREVYDERTSLLPPQPPCTRGGVVINVSSVSALLPCPLLAVYAATKVFVDKFSEELAGEYDGRLDDGKHDPSQTPRIAVRCLTPGFVATKMSNMRPSTPGKSSWKLMPVPAAATYVRRSLRSLRCHCGCGKARRRVRRRDRRNGSSGDENGLLGDAEGWLAGAFAAVFDSPSSPFSLGRSGIATTGYTSHTLMVMFMNVGRWVMGDAYMSRAVGRYMCQNRDRVARHHAKAAKRAAKAVPE